MEEEKDLEFEEELEPGDALKRLREKLKIAQAERQEYLDASQRLRADYVNLKRESEAARLELTKFANEGLLLETIRVLDSFEPAFSHKESWAGNIDTKKDEEDNMVLEVVQKGYSLHGKVIRPASVRVGHKV